MKRLVFSTDNGWVGLVLRLATAIVMFPHGAQKLLGWYGGYGFSGTMGFFTETKHLPWFVGFLVIVIEFFGPLALLAGFATRVWAAAFTVLAMGIAFSSHVQNGFFMNWFGNQAGEGYEFFLFLIGISVSLLIGGGGKYSVDAFLTKQTMKTHV